MASASYLAFYDLCTLHFVGIVQHVCQGHQQRCTPHAAPAMNMQMNITRMSDVSQLRYKFIYFSIGGARMIWCRNAQIRRTLSFN